MTAAAAYGQSTTYRCVDANGRSTYTNIQEETSGKKCTVVSREVSVVPADRVAPAKPPAQTAATAASRANDRRKILEEELDGEQKRLVEARQKLAEQQGIRNGDEKNFQRVLDRLKPFTEVVERHEKNVEQLQRELASIR
jgi:chromosome segregation ATPase